MVWEREVVRGHALMGGRRPATVEEEMAVTQLEYAKEFLRQRLAGGPLATTGVLREAREVGIRQRTLERARHVLGVKSYFEKKGKWWVVSMETLKPLSH